MPSLKHFSLSIFLTAFLMALTVGLPLYINSLFLATIIDESYIGLLYTFGSFLALFLFAAMPRLLRRFGNHLMTTYTVGGIALLLLFLPYAVIPSLLSLIFILYITLTRILPLYYDIFIENLSSDQSTGGIRGLYYTVLSIGIMVSPLLAGALIERAGFVSVYIVSAALTLLLLFLTRKTYRSFIDPDYRIVSLKDSLKSVLLKTTPLRNIFYCAFLLDVFFSWMIVYMPVYLYNYLAFSWSDIGVIFTIMLIPFVVLEFPLGILADTKFGEKELLITGFIITALATISVSFLTNSSIILWVIVLFMTRVGAAMIEIMAETYFFKHISVRDAHLLSMYRLSRPMGFLIGPLIATFTLLFMPLEQSFIVLGILLLTGIFFAAGLRDTVITERPYKILK